MKLKVYTQDGKQAGTVDISDEIFGGDVNAHLLHQVIKSYLANKRQGTSKTKTRDEVSGGGKKPWKQKGTGRARAGSNTSPVWVRGGKAHGPVPRSYYSLIPQVLRRQALQQALTTRLKDNKVMVVDTITCNPPKTKTINGMLKALSVAGARNLILTDGVKKDIYLSGRNIRDLRVMPVASLNAYDVLSSENIILGAKDMAGKLEQAVAL
jgi:large subunit ribosomal protein L4